MAETLRITYKKSSIGYSQRQKDTVRSLGLRRLGQTVEVPDNGAIRGMIQAVRHLVAIEEAVNAPSSAPVSSNGPGR
jgi:large subunit ribosomal protein L30